MPKQTNLIELWAIHCTTQRFSIVQLRTGPSKLLSPRRNALFPFQSISNHFITSRSFSSCMIVQVSPENFQTTTRSAVSELAISSAHLDSQSICFARCTLGFESAECAAAAPLEPQGSKGRCLSEKTSVRPLCWARVPAWFLPRHKWLAHVRLPRWKVSARCTRTKCDVLERRIWKNERER